MPLEVGLGRTRAAREGEAVHVRAAFRGLVKALSSHRRIRAARGAQQCRKHELALEVAELRARRRVRCAGGERVAEAASAGGAAQ